MQRVTILLMLLGGCHAAVPMPVSPPPTQRVDDLEWPCDRCGEPTQQDVSDGETDGPLWRCERCFPQGGHRRVKRPRRLRPTKLDAAIARAGP